MTNSRASSGALVKLDNHVATGTEATYTFTKTLTWDKYTKIIVIYNLETSATLALQAKINTDATTNQDGRQMIGGTETLIDTGSALLELAGTGIVTASKLVVGELEIYPSNSDYASEQIMGYHTSTSSDAGCVSAGHIGTAGTSITSIELLVSTSTWKAGSRITTYGYLA